MTEGRDWSFPDDGKLKSELLPIYGLEAPSPTGGDDSFPPA